MLENIVIFTSDQFNQMKSPRYFGNVYVTSA